MRSILYLVTALCVIGLAVWAYRENHLTQQAMFERRALELEIATLNETLSVQRAEWAYLNRPDRLRELVDLNFSRLMLVPLTGDQFGEIGQIVYPIPTPRSAVIDAVETFGAFEYMSETGEQP